MKETADFLNGVYESLHNRAMKLESALSSGGFDCSWGWYNCRGNGETKEIRYYPIPVITVHGLGSIWLELNSCYFSADYSKSGLLSLELEKLARRHRFEIFTADDETISVYGIDDEMTKIRTSVFSSAAERFGICVFMPSEQDFNSLREVLAEFRVPEELIEN